MRWLDDHPELFCRIERRELTVIMNTLTPAFLHCLIAAAVSGLKSPEYVRASSTRWNSFSFKKTLFHVNFRSVGVFLLEEGREALTSFRITPTSSELDNLRNFVHGLSLRGQIDKKVLKEGGRNVIWIIQLPRWVHYGAHSQIHQSFLWIVVRLSCEAFSLRRSEIFVGKSDYQTTFVSEELPSILKTSLITLKLNLRLTWHCNLKLSSISFIWPSIETWEHRLRIISGAPFIITQ